jgi:hypothetical protein
MRAFRGLSANEPYYDVQGSTMPARFRSAGISHGSRSEIALPTQQEPGLIESAIAAADAAKTGAFLSVS